MAKWLKLTIKNKSYWSYFVLFTLLLSFFVAYKPYRMNRSNTTNESNLPYQSNATLNQSSQNSSGSGQANTINQPDPTQPLSYTHPDLNFSFEYPGNYKLANLQDEQGETILLQNLGRGAQIYISSFSGKEFNASVVRQNLSNEKLENLKDIAMPGGFNAVSFSGKDQSLGEVWDVWFVAGGKLYQITSQPGHDALLKTLVESFKFN